MPRTSIFDPQEDPGLRPPMSQIEMYELHGLIPEGRLPTPLTAPVAFDLNPPSGLGSRQSENRPGGIVSVEQLRYPVSRKGQKLIRTANRYAEKGESAKAIQAFQEALNEPSAIPYARSSLGVEYLRVGQTALAIPELEEAVRLLPRNAVNHSNLAYALYLIGQFDRAEFEVRQALALDRKSVRTRFVMGLVLVARNARDQQGLELLWSLHEELPAAGIVLAHACGKVQQQDIEAPSKVCTRLGR
jgi:tetratricopeptide (TPR) repeat protein